MSFLDSIGRSVRALGGATTSPIGLIWDLARTDFGGDDEQTEALTGLRQFMLSGLLDLQLYSVRASHPKGFRHPFAALDVPRQEAFQAYGTVSNIGAKAVVRRDPSVLLSGQELLESYRTAGENSLSQGIFGASAAAGFSLLPDEADPRFTTDEALEDLIANPREALKPHLPGYNVLTGTADAISTFFGDPLVVGGKAVKGVKLAIVNPLLPGMDLTKFLQSTPYRKWRQWTKGKSETEILRHPALRENPDAPLLATLIAEANKRGDDEAFDLIHRITWQGDPLARQRLSQQHADISATLESVTRDHGLYRQLQAVERREAQSGMFPNPMFQSDELLEVKDKEYLNLLKSDEKFHRHILGLTEGTSANRPVGLSGTIGLQNMSAKTRIAWRRKNRRESLFPSSVQEVFQPNFYITPLVRIGQAFTDQHPNRWLNPNRADSWREMEASLDRVRGMDVQHKQKLLGNYVRAVNTTEKMHAVANFETSVFNHIAKQLGYGPKTAKRVMGDYFQSRQLAMQKSRSFGAAKREGKRVDVFDVDGTAMRAPILDVQDPNALPLLNVDEIYKNLRRHKDKAGMLEKGLEAGKEGAEAVQTVMDWMNIAWKFRVLMRFGYTARTLWDDETRFLAKVGGMAALTQYGKGMRNLVRNRLVSAEGHPELRERIGDVGFDYMGYRVAGAFEDEAASFRQLASSAQSFDSLLGIGERQHVRDIRQSAQSWRDIRATDRPEEHLAAWRHAINEQLGRSVVARKLMEGNPPDEVASWLRNSKEGRALRRQFPFQSGDVDDWVGRVQTLLSSYMPKHIFTKEFYQKALDRGVTEDDLKRLIPDEGQRPSVHGGILDYNLGDSPVADKVYGIIQKGYHFLNSLPTDVLIRNKSFDHFYRVRMKELIDQADVRAKQVGTHVDQSDIDRYARSARQYALGQMRSLFYDITTKSSAAHSLRFMMPFFAAWQDSLMKWSKLSLEDPSVFFRMNMFLQSPGKAFTPVNEDGQEVPNEEAEYYRMQLPDWLAKQIPGHQSGLQIHKNAFNVWFPGDPIYMPGFGPMAQIPVSEFLKWKPTTEDVLGFFLPYGPSTKPFSYDLALSAVERRLMSLAHGEEDAAFSGSMVNIMKTELGRWQDGKRATKPTWEEIKDRARKLYMLRAFSNMTLPVSVQYRPPSEYQFFIDEYNRFRRENYKTADERFYEKYPDYWFFATSASKSNTGLPASVEAVKASKKYADLIKAAPELASLIVGPEGAGEFSSAAYAWQLGTSTGPGSTEMQRERLSPREALVESQKRRGWSEYRKYMNMIDANLHARGLTNYQVAEAQDLAQIKRLVTERLGELYPEWEEDFKTIDLDVMNQRVKGLETITQDKALLNNPMRSDIRTLQVYLQGRNAFAAELQRRAQAGGAKTLASQSNQDLFLLWSAFQGALVERDTQFGDLYHRYLSNDMLQGAV